MKPTCPPYSTKSSPNSAKIETRDHRYSQASTSNDTTTNCRRESGLRDGSETQGTHPGSRRQCSPCRLVRPPKRHIVQHGQLRCVDASSLPREGTNLWTRLHVSCNGCNANPPRRREARASWKLRRPSRSRPRSAVRTTAATLGCQAPGSPAEVM